MAVFAQRLGKYLPLLGAKAGRATPKAYRGLLPAGAAHHV
jgi:hypothetical protein